MYRSEADRKIVRDVRQRLAELRQRLPWADWRFAVTASVSEQPAWYRHHMPHLFASLEPLLREAGIDLVETEKPFRLVGNIAPPEED